MENLKIRIGSHKKVEPNEVLMLEAVSNYTKVHFATGKILLVATNLKKLENRFCMSDLTFIRTHKSFIINLDYIREFDYSDVVEMDNDRFVTVSRRKKHKLIEAINKASV